MWVAAALVVSRQQCFRRHVLEQGVVFQKKIAPSYYTTVG